MRLCTLTVSNNLDVGLYGHVWYGANTVGDFPSINLNMGGVSLKQ